MLLSRIEIWRERIPHSPTHFAGLRDGLKVDGRMGPAGGSEMTATLITAPMIRHLHDGGDADLPTNMIKLGQKDLHIAPMIDVSTVEFRYFIRLLTKRAIIWNQMIASETLVHRVRIYNESTGKDLMEGYDNDDVESIQELKRYCGWYDGSIDDDPNFNCPHPTVFQIGSSSPVGAAFATHVAHKCGYDAVDLNCGCPSDKVVERCFGAALMKHQDVAAEIVSSMVNMAQSLENPEPVISVKTRIGADDDDCFEFISEFLQRLVYAGCRNFTLHARKVYTDGLSPAQNRTIPPLNYPVVYRVMDHFPHCSFLINGGIMSIEHARKVAYGEDVHFDENGNGMYNNTNNTTYCVNSDHAVPCEICNLPQGSCLGPPLISPLNLTGVMVGRLARDRPADLAAVDRYFYGEPTNPCGNRREVMEKYISFLEKVYPRRCCDDDEMITMIGMAGYNNNMKIVPNRQFCSVCQEFRSHNNEDDLCVSTLENADIAVELETSSFVDHQQEVKKRRAQRHAKYKGCKIVTGIIDRALRPTWGILSGEKGNSAFRRASEDLCRCINVRNCGPGFVLWKAMQAAPDEIWDKPFDLSGESKTSYYPSK